jgi:uncharacterized phiE125 gp8 family phage protein
MGVKQTVAPTAEPITLAEAKTYLRETGTSQDSVITGFVKSAREYAENRTNRQLMLATWVYALDGFYQTLLGGPLVQRRSGLQFANGNEAAGLQVIYLPFPPLVSVSSITYYDADNVLQTLSTSVYDVDDISEPARLKPVLGEVWPITYPRMNAVRITFIAGYANAAAVPAGIVRAMKSLIGHYNENREDNVAGVMVSRVPNSVDMELQSYWTGEVYNASRQAT